MSIWVPIYSGPPIWAYPYIGIPVYIEVPLYRDTLTGIHIEGAGEEADGKECEEGGREEGIAHYYTNIYCYTNNYTNMYLNDICPI